jgi:hypothetical protein
MKFILRIIIYLVAIGLSSYLTGDIERLYALIFAVMISIIMFDLFKE